MKGSFLAVGIIGVLLVLFGVVFALQGDGMIGGSVMSGNTFWIYAGSGVAIVGLILAFLGFSFGSKSRASATLKTKESAKSRSGGSADGSAPTSSQNKK